MRGRGKVSVSFVVLAIPLTLAGLASARSPMTLYGLLLTRIPASELPKGDIKAAIVTHNSLTAMMRSHDAVGSVLITLHGNFRSLLAPPTITYTVFPNEQDALSQYNDETTHDERSAVSHTRAPGFGSLRLKEEMYDSYFAYRNQTNGVTVFLWVTHNVVGKVFVASRFTTSKTPPFASLLPAVTDASFFGIAYLAPFLTHH